jgi:NADH dehydrogenase
MLAERSGAALTRGGQVEVLPDCTLPGHPEVFVVGDLMALGHLPGVAEVAMQSGMHAAFQIQRRLRGDATPRRFRYRNLGDLASISRYFAVAKLGRLEFAGLIGWLLWLVVHLTFLTGFKNRITALFHWAISFLGRARSERTITIQQVLARRALQRTGTE